MVVLIGLIVPKRTSLGRNTRADLIFLDLKAKNALDFPFSQSEGYEIVCRRWSTEAINWDGGCMVDFRGGRVVLSNQER